MGTSLKNDKILLIDLEKCTGCRKCEMACSVFHIGANNPSRSRVKVMKWDYERRCLTGARLYSNWLAGFALFGKTLSINTRTPQKTRAYIPIFRNYPEGTHPFMKRFQRSEQEEKEEPSFYLMVE